MSQCVPNWDLDENPAAPRITLRTHSGSSNTVPTQTPSYEVAELTWENGQLSMQGLGRVANKPIVPSPPTWEKPRAGGTLESIVNQATRHTSQKSSIDTANELVPWFGHHGAMVKRPISTSNTITMDALVPCKNGGGGDEVSTCMAGCSTHVGSCNGGVWLAPVARVANVSESKSGTCGDLGGTIFTSTSPENTSSGDDYTKISTDDYDSLCHSRSQREAAFNAEGKKKLGIAKSSISTKRSRAAAIHNQSERKRRDKINQKMKTLQKLVPNSNKTDKASMLDEVIEYLKQLQAQVHMMRGMNMPSMMLPMAMQQQLQMSMMGMGMGMGMAGMGMGMGVMDMNTISRAAAGMPPVVPPTAAFMPPQPSWDNAGQDRVPTPASIMPDPFSAFLACQSQPMTFDAYSRLAAMYQQFQQNPGYASKK